MTVKQTNLRLFSSILAKKQGPWLHPYCSWGPEPHFYTPEAPVYTERVSLCIPRWDFSL